MPFTVTTTDLALALRVQPIHCDPIVPLPCSRPILAFLEHRQGEQRQRHLVHFVLVVFHRTWLGVRRKAAPRDSDHHRTHAGQTPAPTSATPPTPPPRLL